MDLDDRVPFAFRHVDEHPIAQDAGVVHDHVEAAEDVDRVPDDPLGSLPVAHVVRVRDGLAARRDDLRNDLRRRALGCTRAVARAAEVVNHHPRAVRRQHERVLATDAAAAAGDDGDPSFTQSCHGRGRRRRPGRTQPLDTHGAHGSGNEGPGMPARDVEAQNVARS